MTETNEQLQKIEISIERAKGLIDNLHALMRLEDNKDFKQLISTGYFKDKAAELVLMKAAPHMEDHQEGIIKSIDSIGELKQYFVSIAQQGRMALTALEGDEQTREELLEEDLQEAS